MKRLNHRSLKKALFIALFAILFFAPFIPVSAQPFRIALSTRDFGFTELGVLADMGPWPWAGYSTSDAHLASRRHKLKRWTRAMVKSLQFIRTRKEETFKIAQPEVKHPREVTEGAAEICMKAIDPKNPGGVGDDAMRQNIDLTITQPVKFSASPPLAQLVDFSLLREVQKELGISGRK